MSDTNLTNARIQLKYDTEANWKKNAPTFIPRAGEIIIYSPDANYSTPRFKVGDGENYLITLPFSNDELIMKNGNSDYWLNNSDYIPKAGEIVIINADNADEVASIKIGDGKTSFENLQEFGGSNTGDSITAQKLVNESGAAYNVGDSNNLIYFSNGIPVASDVYVWKTVPASAEFTDTKYTAATTNKEGLMSAEDKITLDNLKNKAVLNTQTASSSQFGVIKLGSNLTELNGVVSVPVATTTSAGVMSATDKAKLDGLNNITIDDTLSSTSTNPIQNRIINTEITKLGTLITEGNSTTLTAAKNYTNDKIGELLGQAPEDLNSLEELAAAMENNPNVVDALRETIGNKANASDLTATSSKIDIHIANENNPHKVTAAQVGLGNVENKSVATIKTEILTKTNLEAVGVSFDTYNEFAGADAGLVPTSAGEEDKYLAADGEWKTISAPEINYPVTSVNGQTGEVQLTAADIGALSNDTELFSGNYTDLSGAPILADVATSGSYNDLDDKPPIPQAITIDTTLSTTSTNPVQNNVINTALGNKVDKVSGKGLSTNDFTAAYKNKLDNLDTTLNNKQNAITGAATTITSNNLTANRALISDSSGKISVSSITNTKLGYLSGVTSDIQTQLDNKIDKDDTSSIVNNSSVLSALGKTEVEAGEYAAYTANYGNYTNNIYIPSFTVDAYGRITEASCQPIIAPYATISGKTNAWNGAKGSASQPIYFDSNGQAQTCNTIPDTSNFLTSTALTDYALKSEVPTNISNLTNDSGYITSSALSGYATTSDLTKYVPTTRTINGASLSSNLTRSDIGANKCFIKSTEPTSGMITGDIWIKI